MTKDNALSIISQIPANDINWKNANGLTLLHCDSKVRSVEAVKCLINSGAMVNITDHFGKTFLHRAAEGNHSDCINLLLESGADVDATALEGATPLHLAAQMDNTNAVISLIKGGADASIKSANGLTALELADKAEYYESVEVLRQALEIEGNADRANEVSSIDEATNLEATTIGKAAEADNIADI